MFLYQAYGNLISINTYGDNIIEHLTPTKLPLRYGQIVEMNLNIGDQNTADQFTLVKIFKVMEDSTGQWYYDDTYTGEIKSDDPVVIKNAANTDFKIIVDGSRLKMIYDPTNNRFNVEDSTFFLSKVKSATSYTNIQLDTDSIRAGEKIFLSYHGRKWLNSNFKTTNCGLFGCALYDPVTGRFGHGGTEIKDVRTISINTYYNKVGRDKIEDPIKYGDIVNISNLLDGSKDNLLGNYVKILKADDLTSTANILVNDQVIIVDANDSSNLKRILYDTEARTISYHIILLLI